MLEWREFMGSKQNIRLNQIGIIGVTRQIITNPSVHETTLEKPDRSQDLLFVLWFPAVGFNTPRVFHSKWGLSFNFPQFPAICGLIFSLLYHGGLTDTEQVGTICDIPLESLLIIGILWLVILCVLVEWTVTPLADMIYTVGCMASEATYIHSILHM
jgi:hypothetical protein